MVRGICCLRPGVPGLSDNIRVRSVVGRFLEHSRIFWFGAGKEDPLQGEYYIGSADWMYRNLQTRVEAAAPVQGAAQRQLLWDILQVCLEDRRSAWELLSDGTYRPPNWSDLAADDPRAMGTHQRLMQFHRLRSEARRGSAASDPSA